MKESAMLHDMKTSFARARGTLLEDLLGAATLFGLLFVGLALTGPI
jgi:hypothetical protein